VLNLLVVCVIISHRTPFCWIPILAGRAYSGEGLVRRTATSKMSISSDVVYQDRQKFEWAGSSLAITSPQLLSSSWGKRLNESSKDRSATTLRQKTGSNSSRWLRSLISSIFIVGRYTICYLPCRLHLRILFRTDMQIRKHGIIS
jgi:hypothetical protein